MRSISSFSTSTQTRTHAVPHVAWLVLAALVGLTACDWKSGDKTPDATDSTKTSDSNATTSATADDPMLLQAEIEEAQVAAREQLEAGKTCMEAYEACTAEPATCMMELEACVAATNMSDDSDDDDGMQTDGEKNPHWKQGKWKKHGWLREAMRACMPEHLVCAKNHPPKKDKDGDKMEEGRLSEDTTTADETQTTSADEMDTTQETTVETHTEEDDDHPSLDMETTDADPSDSTDEGEDDHEDETGGDDMIPGDHGMCKEQLRMCMHDAMATAYEMLCSELVTRCEQSMSDKFEAVCENIRRKCDEFADDDATTSPDEMTSSDGTTAGEETTSATPT